MLKPWLLLDCTCAKHRDVFWVLEPYLVRAGFELVRCTSAQEMRTRVVEAMNDEAEGEQRQCVMLLANYMVGLSDFVRTLPEERRRRLLRVVCVIHGLGETKYYFRLWKKHLDGVYDAFVVSPNQFPLMSWISPRFVALPYFFMEFYKREMWRSRYPGGKRDFCATHGLMQDRPIVLYAPSWISPKHVCCADNMQGGRLRSDHDTVIHQLDLLRKSPHLLNVVHSPHREGALKRSCGIGIGNEYGSVEERTPYILPFADVVISDVSSVMFEFCYFERSVVQLRMSSYPDNPTLDYELPTCTDDLSRLSLGVSTRPDGLVACVTEALAAESFEKGTRPAMHGVLEKKKELDVERRDGAQ